METFGKKRKKKKNPKSIYHKTHPNTNFTLLFSTFETQLKILNINSPFVCLSTKKIKQSQIKPTSLTIKSLYNVHFSKF